VSEDQVFWILEYIPAVIGLAVAIMIVRYTRSTNHLTKRLAEAQLNPYVIAVLENEPGDDSCFDLVVRNVGRSPARRVKINFDFHHGSPISKPVEEHIRQVAFLNEEVSYLGPSQEIRAPLGTGTELQLSKIWIAIAYDRDTPGAEAQRFRDEFFLELDVLLGLRRPFMYQR
jgi:hypothetical protein